MVTAVGDKKHPGIDNLRPWKKGESGNPSGREPLPPEIKKLRKLTKKEFADIAAMVVKGSWSELELIAKDSEETVLRRKLAKGILDEGYKTFDEILNRIIGKVKEEVEVSLPKPTIIRRANGEAMELGAKIEDEED